ncbi:MAG: hypothetical protein IJR90_00540 [Clostridia bacterium]|nr:hypothetical protein [Clostridia bacterium]
MLMHLKEKLNILRGKKIDAEQGKTLTEAESSDYARVKKLVRRQAILAIGTLIAVVVLLFAMTSAWYTNVSKASTLVFRTEVWGFDSANITVSDAAILVAPGRSGVIPLSVDNAASKDGITIYLTVSKAPMSANELRRRIYFYADTSRRINDENVSRIYLGSTEDNTFSYDILPGRQLIMSDDYYNDVPIKWEWVYDVEGYYFRGTVNGSGVTLDEYLRPIEYDFDNAVFDLVGNLNTGKLLSVGGVSTADYLAAISAADGYEGTIDVLDAVTVGTSDYYPVAVDENGNGVWAYLMTYGEIEREIEYDTSISSSEHPLQITATLNVSVVNIPSRSQPVGTDTEFYSAIRDPNVEVVELTNDLSLSMPVSVINGDEATINLNGYNITYTGSESEYSAIVARNGAKLTIMNGDIVGNGNGSGREGVVSSIGVSSIGGEVTLSNVNIRDFDTAVYAADYAGTGSDTIMRIYHCDLETENPTIFFMGNGDASEALSQLIIQDSRINSTGYIGISGQGSTNRWGTDVVILDSEVSGYYAAYFQPQQRSTALISRSTLTGITGIAVKGGTVNIVDSTVTGTGPHTNAAATGNGWTDTGDGVYLEGAYNWNATISIDGNSTISSAHSYAVEMVGKQGAGKGKIIINDGTYTGALGVANWNEIGEFSIYGGNFGAAVIPESISRYDLLPTPAETEPAETEPAETEGNG